MNARDVDTTSSRVSWGLVISAISALTAWAYQRLRAQPAGARAAWGAYPTATPATGRAGSAPRGATRPTRRPLDDEADSPSSALSQLRKDFTRFPPKELAKRDLGQVQRRRGHHALDRLRLPLGLRDPAPADPDRDDRGADQQRHERASGREPARPDQRARAGGFSRPAPRSRRQRRRPGWRQSRQLRRHRNRAGRPLGRSNGVALLILGFNRAYDVEEDRPFVRKKLITIG